MEEEKAYIASDPSVGHRSFCGSSVAGEIFAFTSMDHDGTKSGFAMRMFS